jgi:hypothetical protein
VRFELGARGWRGLKIERGPRRVYRLPVPIPECGEIRHVEIRFEDWSRVPDIYVDGPSGGDASPHRYKPKQLCIWYPRDPPEQKWVFEDGLLMLICHIQLHLFREAWWRETGGRKGGEWLGPQAPHAEPKEEDAGDGDRERERPDVPRPS